MDMLTAREGSAGPGQDTRQWFSYGTVDADQEGQRSVDFDAELGPLVSVTLHPSGAPVRCRVGSTFAGAGEGEYYPFVAGEEVYVAIPEGDERAGAIITGRAWNRFDTFPTVVAGNDVTKNNFGFRRMRAPFMIETASAYGIRNAGTGSLFMMEAGGIVTLKDGFTDFLHLGPDFVGLQASDDDSASPVLAPGSTMFLFQLDKKAKQIRAEIQGSSLLILDKVQSYIATNGAFQVAAGGAQATEHVATVEAVVNLLNQVVTLLGPFFTIPLTPVQVLAIVNGAIVGASVGSVGAFQTTLTSALASKLPNPTGLRPSVGCPAFFAA